MASIGPGNYSLCGCTACVVSRGRAKRCHPCSAPPTHHVAVGLLRRGDQYLIGLRPPGRPLAGIWEAPGGKQEAGETLEQCLMREWREELAVDILVGEQIWTDVFVFPDGVFEVTAFLVVLGDIDATPKALVHECLRYATPHKISQLPVIPSMYSILRILQESDL